MCTLSFACSYALQFAHVIGRTDDHTLTMYYIVRGYGAILARTCAQWSLIQFDTISKQNVPGGAPEISIFNRMMTWFVSSLSIWPLCI